VLVLQLSKNEPITILVNGERIDIVHVKQTSHNTVNRVRVGFIASRERVEIVRTKLLAGGQPAGMTPA